MAGVHGQMFRPDIQGLRAVAVLAVMLYHAGLPGIPGGFVGVDIFFVVSGYLICGLLDRELTATGRIDLAGFWLRRARRLLPNATLVLLAVLAVAAVFRPNFIFKDVAADVMAAAVYAANLRFAGKGLDYFADDTTASPVLHFWSLSVEEQFYIAWPLLLVAGAGLLRRRFAGDAIWLLAAVWILSFTGAMTAAFIDQPTAFYHAELRAWQLATGGMAALVLPRLGGRFLNVRHGAAWAGTLGIAVALLGFGETMLYPGPAALVPTLATAALLLAPSTVQHRWTPASLLSLRPLGWVGDRSYSLYLWHWPALVLGAALFPMTPYVAAWGLAFGAVAALAAYRFVEEPIRRGRNLGLPTSTWTTFAGLAASGGAVAAVLAAGLILPVLALPRPGTDIARLERQLEKAKADTGRAVKARCVRRFKETDQPDCAFGDTSARRTAVLFGDSHAAQWTQALDKAASASGWRLLVWTKSACPAAELATWNKRLRRNYTECDAWREAILARLTGSERPQKVFLSNYASFYGGAGEVRAGIESTIRRLQGAGIETVVIADTPVANRRFSDCLYRYGAAVCGSARASAVPAVRPDAEAAWATNSRLVDLTDRICDAETCPVVRDGMIVYRDHHHLAARFVASLADAFTPLLPPLDAEAGLVTSSIGPLPAN